MAMSKVLGGPELKIHSFAWHIKNFGAVANDVGLIGLQRFEFEAGGAHQQQLSKWRVSLKAGNHGETTDLWIGIHCELIEGHEHFGVNSRAEFCFVIKTFQAFLSTNTARWCNLCSKNVQGLICPTCNSDLQKFAQSGALHPCVDISKKTELASVGECRNGVWVRDGINRSTLESYIDKDGVLTIYCTLKIFSVEDGPDYLQEVRFSLNEFQEKAIRKKKADMERLLVGNFPTDDVTIRTSDEEERTANWGVLMVRSPVFAKMYESNLIEREEGVINLKNISEHTYTVLHHFIYNGELLPDWRDDEVIVELLNAAAMYELTDLLEFLNGVLGSVCNTQTASQLLSLAEKLQLKRSEEDVLNWIKQNCPTEFLVKLRKDKVLQNRKD